MGLSESESSAGQERELAQNKNSPNEIHKWERIYKLLFLASLKEVKMQLPSHEGQDQIAVRTVLFSPPLPPTEMSSLIPKYSPEINSFWQSAVFEQPIVFQERSNLRAKCPWLLGDKAETTLALGVSLLATGASKAQGLESEGAHNDHLNSFLPSFLSFFFKTWKAELQSEEGGTEKQKSSACWFTAQTSTLAGARLQPGTPSRSLIRVAGVQARRPPSTAFPRSVSIYHLLFWCTHSHPFFI